MNQLSSEKSSTDLWLYELSVRPSKQKPHDKQKMSLDDDKYLNAGWLEVCPLCQCLAVCLYPGGQPEIALLFKRGWAAPFFVFLFLV